MNKIKSVFTIFTCCFMLEAVACGTSNVNEVTDTSTIEKNNSRNEIDKKDNTGDVTDDVTDDVTNMGTEALDTVGDTGKDILDGAEDLGDDVINGVGDAVKDIMNGDDNSNRSRSKR